MRPAEVRAQLHAVLGYDGPFEEDAQSLDILGGALREYEKMKALHAALDAHLALQIDEARKNVAIHEEQINKAQCAPDDRAAVLALGEVAALLQCENPFASEIAVRLGRLECQIMDCERELRRAQQELADKQKVTRENQTLIQAALDSEDVVAKYQSAVLSAKQQIMRAHAMEDQQVVEIGRLTQACRNVQAGQ